MEGLQQTLIRVFVNQHCFVTASGVAKLLDFGLAKQSEQGGPPVDGAESLSVTQGGLIMGTPAYMSPEQAEGKPADARSDIFSFGAILYELVAGRRAFPGTSAASVLGAILHRNPDPISAPPVLTAIIFKCLAQSPNDRFQSAAELLEALEQASNNGVFPIANGKKHLRLGVGIACSLLIIAAVCFAIYRKTFKPSPIDSIAVIPFEIQSKDSEAGYIQTEFP